MPLKSLVDKLTLALDGLLMTVEVQEVSLQKTKEIILSIQGQISEIQEKVDE